LRISSISSCVKYSCNRARFQVPSGNMKSETHRYLHLPWLDRGLCVDSLGIHGSCHTRIFVPVPTLQMTPCFSKWRPYSIACHVDDPFPENTVSIKKPLG
jgi:hypothetical protein